MTNHPRRAGRRKHQRAQDRRWTDITPYLAVKLGTRVFVGESTARLPAVAPTRGQIGRAG